MDYKDVNEARSMPGLRLALTRGVPGPWSESAKSIFHVKGIAYTPVAQYGGQANEDLVAWTGCRNAPVAVWNDEAPRSGWLEILMLAERLAPEKPLLPANPATRALTIGLSHEICGEGGLGWCRRIAMLPDQHVPREKIGEGFATMRDAYGFWEMSKASAAERCVEILDLLAETLRMQKSMGHAYLAGQALTCLDIYWASFAQILKPMPDDVAPMPDYIRQMYSSTPDPVLQALDPQLLEHRDMIFRNHLVYPLDF